MSANTLVATLLAMAGQRNVITIPRAFVRFTGDLEAAMLLNQLLYWMPRSHLDGDSIYKTDAEWQEELCLTRYAVRHARDCLIDMGFLTTSVHHQKGSRAVHYHIDYELLVEKWEAWLSSEGVKSENELNSGPSKVRKQTLPVEQSSNPDEVKFESRRSMNHRVPTEIHDDGGVGRALAFLESEGIGAAKEFATLPYESMVLDYRNRIAAGQSAAIIVKAWRSKPPTKDYHYEQPRPVERNDAPDRPGRPPSRPRGSHNGTGGAELRDPGWMEREIAAAEARARSDV
jgi:hypothetical protein